MHKRKVKTSYLCTLLAILVFAFSPTLRAQGLGKLHIIAVGINDYPNFVSFKYPIKDCSAIISTFEKNYSPLYSSMGEVIFLKDSLALLNSVKDAFGIVSRRSKPEDTFVFYFAGAGWSSEVNIKEFNLFLYNFTPNTNTLKTQTRPAPLPGIGVKKVGVYDSTSLTSYTLLQLLNTIQANNQLVIFDAGNTSEAFRAFCLELNKENLLAEDLKKKFFVLSTLGYGLERNSIQHGELTFSLLKALSKDSDTNGDHFLTTSELRNALDLILYNPALEFGTMPITYSSSDFPLLFMGTKDEYGESRGLAPSYKNESLKIAPPNNYAILFGTSNYAEWKDLANPTKDVETIAIDLKETYGFDTEIVTDGTKEQIIKKILEYKSKLSENSSLLLYFAGHGYYDNNVNQGFIVASDSKIDDITAGSYIPHSFLQGLVNNLQIKHLLLVLDICHGGTFNEEARGSGSIYEPISGEELINTRLKYKSRKLITSGGNEEVPDGVPGLLSPFARKFLDALRSNGGEDGVLTFAELYSYLEKGKITPRWGGFGYDEPGSDFLFLRKR